MKVQLTIVLIFIIKILFSQQYDSVYIEEDSIDVNNNIYKTGSVYIFDYEIIENNERFKLNKNYRTDFEFISIEKDSINIDRIHLIVKSTEDKDKTNQNQTQISYLEGPIYSTYTSTGLIDNDINIWMHPIRSGFFSSLETCPFPYVKLPMKIGNEWLDSMLIGSGWGNEKWGEWNGNLLQEYSYKVTGKEKIQSKLGLIECFVIDSKAKSKKGETILKSYFSEKYGFVRLEYILLTDIKVNLWLIEFKENKEFNNVSTFFRIKDYIKY